MVWWTGRNSRAFLPTQATTLAGQIAAAQHIAQGLRDAILGDQLLDIEIDRRRPDALAILGRRDDALGKSSLRHASAMRATVNRGLMFGDHERALGNVENLPPLDSRRRLCIERRTAMAARTGLVSNHGVGIGDLPQSPTFVARLAAAPLARTTAQTSRNPRFLFSPSLDGGLELFELSKSNRRRSSATSARSAVISAFSEAIKSAASAGISIPHLIQICRSVSPKTGQANQIRQHRGLSDSPGLGVTKLRNSQAGRFRRQWRGGVLRAFGSGFGGCRGAVFERWRRWI